MNKKLVYIILAALAVAIAVLAVLNRPGAAPVSGELTVVLADGGTTMLDAAAIAALPVVEIEKEIVSSGAGRESGVFAGVALRTLLAAVDPDWADGAKRIVSRAEDGFVSAFAVEEVAADDNIIVAYLLDGAALAAKADGGSGPFRIIIRDDRFGNRSTRWLSQLEVR